jgi:hypothetical protein
MHTSEPYGAYDQGFFNTACKLVDEIASRSYLHFLVELDASGMDDVRASARAGKRTVPTYTAFVVKAAAQALSEHPHLNCMIQETPLGARLVRLPEVTATVAVERMVDGVDMVFAPMLRDVDRLPVETVTSDLRHFAEAEVQDVPEFRLFYWLVKAARWLPTLVGRIFRIPSLGPGLWRKYRGGSFAVTSPGKYGGCDQVLPPWLWPLTFSFGAVKVRPWVEDGRVVARKTMRLTITSDRRLANGAPLARFAERVKEILEYPELMGLSFHDGNDNNGRLDSLPAEPSLNEAARHAIEPPVCAGP